MDKECALKQLSYDEALAEQAARVDRPGWILFSCPPTITLGRRAVESDLLVDRAACARRGIRVLDVDRGGEVTYHGPGQIVGFPCGRLEDHVGDSRGVRVFVDGLKDRLARVIEELGHVIDRDECGAGLWVRDAAGGPSRKMVSIGLKFSGAGIGHGFALNVQPLAEMFALINPCGVSGGPPVASLFAERRPESEVVAVAEALVDILHARR